VAWPVSFSALTKVTTAGRNFHSWPKLSLVSPTPATKAKTRKYDDEEGNKIRVELGTMPPSVRAYLHGFDIPPIEARTEILETTHGYGHDGVDGMIAKLTASRIYWPSMHT
jgi:hypothetical protein